MTLVVYNDKQKFVLTKSEKVEARKFWARRENYFCKRIDSSLSPFYLYFYPLYKMIDRFDLRVYDKNIKHLIFVDLKNREIWNNFGLDDCDKVVESIVGDKKYNGIIPNKVCDLENNPVVYEEIIKKSITIDDFLDHKFVENNQ